MARCRAWPWASPARQNTGGRLPSLQYRAVDREDESPSGLRITLAVAGFSVDELAVTIEGGELIVRGKQADERSRDYIYRGIAARRFKRSFGLADGVEVRKAELHDGLLAIELERPMKDVTVRTVRIIGGEVAGKRREALPPKAARVSDAE